MHKSRLHPRFHLGTLLFSFAVQLLVMCAASVLLTGCALPNPETLVSPAPLQGNAGKYLNPYLVDGTLAPWAEKGVHTSRLGAAMGGLVASEMIGYVDVTGLASQGADTAIKQQGAISAAGGKEYMKSTSDTSFDRREDFAVYLYVNHSTKELYKKALELMKEIYPDMGSNYESDVRNAPKKPVTAPVSPAPAKRAE
jgi:hypothetical protein